MGGADSATGEVLSTGGIASFASISSAMRVSLSSSPSKKLGGSPRQVGLGGRDSPSNSPSGLRRARSLAAAFGDAEAGGKAAREEAKLEGEQACRHITKSIDVSDRRPDPGFECWKIASNRGSEALGEKETSFYTFGGSSLTRVASSFESPERRMKELEEDVNRRKRRGWNGRSSKDPSAKYWEGQKVKSDREWEKVKSRKANMARRPAKGEKDKGKENKPRNVGFWGLGGGKPAPSAPPPESPVKSPAKKKTRSIPVVACVSMNGACLLPRSKSEPAPQDLEPQKAEPRPSAPRSVARVLSLPIPTMTVSESVHQLAGADED